MGKLAELAVKYGSDKHGHHDYCDHYERHIGSLVDTPSTLFELGVGGYEFADKGGAGMKMFRDYLPKTKVVGIDIHAKNGLDLPGSRMKFYRGSQDDKAFLHSVIMQEGRPMVVIDDASHINKLTIESFRILFPYLLPGGVYVIEDIESSFWPDNGFGGNADVWDTEAPTTLNMIRSLIIPVNEKYIPKQPGKLAPISSIHFYPNIVFIHKSAQ